ncbi:MAG: hypothetical protein WC685_12450 [Methylobacter sp.]|jgi:hypothetical protein
MKNYEQGKKVRRITAVVYLLIMGVVVGGTYLSQQQKEAVNKASQTLPTGI